MESRCYLVCHLDWFHVTSEAIISPCYVLECSVIPLCIIRLLISADVELHVIFLTVIVIYTRRQIHKEIHSEFSVKYKRMNSEARCVRVWCWASARPCRRVSPRTCRALCDLYGHCRLIKSRSCPARKRWAVLCRIVQRECLSLDSVLRRVSSRECRFVCTVVCDCVLGCSPFSRQRHVSSYSRAKIVGRSIQLPLHKAVIISCRVCWLRCLYDFAILEFQRLRINRASSFGIKRYRVARCSVAVCVIRLIVDRCTFHRNRTSNANRPCRQISAVNR